MLVSLMTVPAFVHAIGKHRYGVVATLMLILGYSGVVNLGLGKATSQRIAALGAADGRQSASVLWTSVVVNFALGVVGGFLVWPFASYLLEHRMEMDGALRSEVSATLPWVLFAFPVTTLSGVLAGALVGVERFLLMNAILVTNTCLLQVVPLLVAMSVSVALDTVVASIVILNVVCIFALFAAVYLVIIKDHGFRFSFAEARRLLTYGGWVALTSLVGPLMTVADRFVIGAVQGAAAVTEYNVPYRLGVRTTVLSNAVSRALFPRLSGPSTDGAKMDRVFEAVFRSLLVVGTPLTVLAVVVIEPFLSVWISEDFGLAAGRIGRVLCVGFWANGLALLPLTKLMADGKPDLVAKAHLSELVPYFIAMGVGLHFFGVVGAAVAFSLRVALDFVVLSVMSNTFSIVRSRVAVPVSVLMLVLAVEEAVGHSYAARLVADGIIMTFTVVWSVRTAPEELRRLILSRLSRNRG